MSVSPDYIIERKRNKQLLTKWKLFALFLVLSLLYFVIEDSEEKPGVVTPYSKTKDYIARINIEEIIFENFKRQEKLQDILEDDAIKAVIIHVNSPGGTVVGSEMLYNSIKKIAKEKPVVVVMGSVAASGGYLISLGADYIICHNGTITGSIGVLIQSAEITELAEKLGIKFHNFKSGELKAMPNYAEKLTDEAKEAVMDNIFDTYDYFIQQVSLQRKLDIKNVRKIADGRVYSARQALKLKLVDAIGNEDDAIEWLQKKKGISEDLKVKDYKLSGKNKFIDTILEDLDTKISNVIMNKFQKIQLMLMN
ncbi:MAG: signal peptide peptidase SppA [Rickettsiaceae bacterium]|nr:signal peptide peptidase SppA [Rickettsiaceae bacterium]